MGYSITPLAKIRDYKLTRRFHRVVRNAECGRASCPSGPGRRGLASHSPAVADRLQAGLLQSYFSARQYKYCRPLKSRSFPTATGEASNRSSSLLTARVSSLSEVFRTTVAPLRLAR